MKITNSGPVSVRYLTFQNGNANDNAGGLSVFSGGGVIVDYNIMRDNIGTEDGGVDVNITDLTSTADLQFSGNLIAGNTVTQTYAAGVISNAGLGNTYITNNTVANNTTSDTASPQLGAFYVGTDTGAGNQSPNVSNNIFWGNGSIDLELINAPILTNNDFHVASGAMGISSSGDLNVEPLFSSSTDFQLQLGSPLLAAGVYTPAGGLPTIDIEGNPRSFEGKVDIGAYERGDFIFKDGFDD